jgi:transcriptional regulator with XRE-family HTH domain
MGLGSKISDKRKALGLTQEQLADQLHVTRQTLSKWEGNISKPDIDSLTAMAKIFGCSVNDLLSDDAPVEKSDNPAQTPSKLPHVFGILSIILGALGLLPGLIFAIIGKKQAQNPKDRALNKIGLGISIGGLIVWMVAGSIGGYYLGQYLAKKVPPVTSTSSQTTSKNPEGYYTVRFLDYDYWVLQSSLVKDGDKVIYSKGNPTRPTDAQYIYTFAGWDHDLNQPIHADTDFHAQYSTTLQQYDCIFYDDSGATLYEAMVEYGSYATFKGTRTPSKEMSDQYTYTFASWYPDPATTPIHEATNFHPTFTKTTRRYTATFLNYDSTAVLGTYMVDYGSYLSESIAPSNPTKPSDNQYTYAFDQWSPSLTDTQILRDTTFVPTFIKSPRIYSVSFCNDDGSVYATRDFLYGQTATLDIAAPSKTGDDLMYTFAGWYPDPSTHLVSPENTKFTATYTSSMNTDLLSFTLLNDGTYSVGSSSTTYNWTNLRLSSQYQGKDITAIADNGFNFHNNALGTLTLPSNLRSFGSQSFCGYGSSSFDIPSGVNSIGDSAFYGSSVLTDVTLPGTITSLGTEIFSECTALKHVTFNEGITSLPKAVLWASTEYHSEALSSVYIPSTITTMTSGAFSFSYTVDFYLNFTAVPSSWPSDWAGNNAHVILYSASKPAESETSNYWRFVDGKPTKWVY